MILQNGSRVTGRSLIFFPPFNIFPVKHLLFFSRGTLVYQMYPSPWHGVKILSVWALRETTI